MAKKDRKINREMQIKTSVRYNPTPLRTKVKVLVTQSCPTLCNPMDCSPPGSSVHGILQARTLEWVAISSSKDLPDPGIEPTFPAFQADS